MLAKQYLDEQVAFGIEQLQALPSTYAEELDQVLSTATPELLASFSTQLVVGSQAQADAYRQLLDAKGLTNIGTLVAAPVPTEQRAAPEAWTPVMAEAKAQAWQAQQPRHAAKFTKAQSSMKARKSARRRAKAGRKSSR
jgi:hypothetical protein